MCKYLMNISTSIHIGLNYGHFKFGALAFLGMLYHTSQFNKVTDGARYISCAHESTFCRNHSIMNRLHFLNLEF